MALAPEGSDEFPRQCRAWRRTCLNCGSRFLGQETCPTCGAKRPRCRNRRMDDEEVCRSHSFGRTYTLYRRLTAHLTDVDLDEFLERPDANSLHQEFALAKIAVATAHGDSAINPRTLLEMIRTLFEIAEKKKRIEEGVTLNIRMDDKMSQHIRKEAHRIIKAFVEVIDDMSPNIRQEVLFKVKEKLRLPGNTLTLQHGGRLLGVKDPSAQEGEDT